MATAYAELHDLDEAFRWLAKGYGERSPQLSFLQAEPRFDPLRADPRYADPEVEAGMSQFGFKPLTRDSRTANRDRTGARRHQTVGTVPPSIRYSLP
jgi:hypothetical protein